MARPESRIQGSNDSVGDVTRPLAFDRPTRGLGRRRPVFWEPETVVKIEQTQHGLLALAAGALLSWIPRVAALGAILSLIGVILVVRGCQPFGRRHASYARISLLTVGSGAIGTIIASLALIVVLAVFIRPEIAVSDAAQWMGLAFALQIVGGIAIAAVLGTGHLLLTYALQRSIGRALLMAAFVILVAIAIWMFISLAPILNDAVRTAASGENLAALGVFHGVERRVDELTFLTAGPFALLAAAYYLAWSRIWRGEIPERPTKS